LAGSSGDTLFAGFLVKPREFHPNGRRRIDNPFSCPEDGAFPFWLGPSSTSVSCHGQIPASKTSPVHPNPQEVDSSCVQGIFNGWTERMQSDWKREAMEMG
jgi:hypothetical protein